MAEKPHKRPSTPKRSGPNTIVRDEDALEELAAMKIHDQKLKDSLRPQDIQSKGKRDKSPKRAPTPKRGQAGPHAVIMDKKYEKAVQKIHEQEYGKQEVSSKGNVFGAKSPKQRPQTPKRETHGPHAIKVDKKVEKAVKKIYKREYPEHLRPQDFPSKEKSEGEKAKSDKSPKRPPTPKREQAGRNKVVLDKNTEEVVRKHLEMHEGYIFPLPETPSLEVSPKDIGEKEVLNGCFGFTAKSKKGQVSPKSPHPQPSPLFPTEEPKKVDPKYNVQEALLTASKVGTVAFPAANTAKPHIVESTNTAGLGGFMRTFSGRFKGKKKRAVRKEPDMDLSTATDTSVHTSLRSTSLPSELFEDRLSETWTPSSVTPARDMTPSRLEKLDQDDENLSDSFPSEVAEGAYGGHETEQVGLSQEQLQQPDTRGKGPRVKRALSNVEEDPDDDNEPQSKFQTNVVWCKELTPQQREYLEKQKTIALVVPRRDKTSEDGGFKDTQFATPDSSIPDEFSGEPHSKQCSEASVDERKWGRGKSCSQMNKHERKVDGADETKVREVFRIETIKLGVLQTPDGDFWVSYMKKPDDEVVVINTFPMGSGKSESRHFVDAPAERETKSSDSSSTDSEREFSNQIPTRTASAYGSQAAQISSESSDSSGSDSDADVDY